MSSFYHHLCDAVCSPHFERVSPGYIQLIKNIFHFVQKGSANSPYNEIFLRRNLMKSEFRTREIDQQDLLRRIVNVRRLFNPHALDIANILDFLQKTLIVLEQNLGSFSEGTNIVQQVKNDKEFALLNQQHIYADVKFLTSKLGHGQSQTITEDQDSRTQVEWLKRILKDNDTLEGGLGIFLRPEHSIDSLCVQIMNYVNRMNDSRITFTTLTQDKQIKLTSDYRLVTEQMYERPNRTRDNYKFTVGPQCTKELQPCFEVKDDQESCWFYWGRDEVTQVKITDEWFKTMIAFNIADFGWNFIHAQEWNIYDYEHSMRFVNQIELQRYLSKGTDIYRQLNSQTTDNDWLTKCTMFTNDELTKIHSQFSGQIPRDEEEPTRIKHYSEVQVPTRQFHEEQDTDTTESVTPILALGGVVALVIYLTS